jgi:hypothetical protein
MLVENLTDTEAVVLSMIAGWPRVWPSTPVRPASAVRRPNEEALLRSFHYMDRVQLREALRSLKSLGLIWGVEGPPPGGFESMEWSPTTAGSRLAR